MPPSLNAFVSHPLVVEAGLAELPRGACRGPQSAGVIVELTSSARVGQVIAYSRPDPILLLGAGSSLKSGVPLAGTVAELAIRYAYCREHGRSEDDQSVRRSDWHTWVSAKSWFDSSAGMADQ